MMPSSYSVSRFMTLSPERVDADAPLELAHQLMQRAHIRHLPVVDGGQLVGVVSLVDLYFAEREGPGETLRVRDAMEAAVTVSPDASLEQVGMQMASARLDAVVVVDGGGIAGLFTTVDALNALAWLAGPEERRVIYAAVKAAVVGPTARDAQHGPRRGLR